jgi:hypothetical protein
MQHLEGSGTPVLYIGRTVLKVKNVTAFGEQSNLASCIRKYSPREQQSEEGTQRRRTRW